MGISIQRYQGHYLTERLLSNLPLLPGIGARLVPDLPVIEEVANIKHITDNMAYYRQEPIINRVFTYGETAAFFRALKQAGVNLPQLAHSME